MNSEKINQPVAPAFQAAVAIVTAFLQNATCPQEKIGALFRDVHEAALAALRLEETAENVEFDDQGNIIPLPAVPIENSVSDESIVCLEDGTRHKSLKRYLATKFGLTPDQYRQKWRLPSDYPMVAPFLSRRRSEVARQTKPHTAKKK
ncbi:MucR family transcriptional regulator [Microvirga sp. W0021]|uniref:MucR family transcriptional regulator n=1 Tax=Hohaiivirga grylli TaxID=3133970 RepID=A0ABV0BL75_9HYPH